MLRVFADESADETQSRVFAMAGVVAQEHVWQAAEQQWVARTGGQVFHATDCEREEKGRALYKDLVTIMAASGLSGYGVALDLAAFKGLFGEMRQDLGFYKCLMMVVGYLTERAHSLGQPIQFTFHKREASDRNTKKLFEILSNQPDWGARVVLQEQVTFEKLRNPRIQMADLFARETMKSLDYQLGPVKREPRASMLALCGRGKRFGIGLIDREYCEKWHQATTQSTVGEEYGDWLAANHLQDNWSNRIRFMAEPPPSVTHESK